MPPRYAYWTIILEGKPTAFRAHTRDELVPTFKQLHARHPDTVLMWFARGRLWPSQDDERAAAAAKREAAKVRRGAEWRPGGAHRDPRDRFKVPRDEKRRRFAAKLHRDRREGEPPGAPRSQDARGQHPPGPRTAKRPYENRARGPRSTERTRGGAGSPHGGHRPGRPRDRRNPRGRGGGGSSR